jgi:hypothetical protein
MSQPPPGRIPVPLPFHAYTWFMLWSALAVACAYTVFREVAYVQATNGIGWTIAPALLTVIYAVAAVRTLIEIHRKRHPAGQH